MPKDQGLNLALDLLQVALLRFLAMVLMLVYVFVFGVRVQNIRSVFFILSAIKFLWQLSILREGFDSIYLLEEGAPLHSGFRGHYHWN